MKNEELIMTDTFLYAAARPQAEFIMNRIGTGTSQSLSSIIGTVE